jgi:hypothetical protein
MPDDEEREAHPTDQALPFPTIRVKLGEPLADAEYDSEDALLQAYRDHAYNKGYGVVWDYNASNKMGKRIIYQCDKGGKPRPEKRNQALHKYRE